MIPDNSLKQAFRIRGLKTKLPAVFAILILLIPEASAADTTSGIDMSGIIVRLISFLLGICGATYLAAGLWSRSEKGSGSWKYLSISMILFVFWNIIGAFSVMLDMLEFQKFGNTVIPEGTLREYQLIAQILDPVIEVTVFIILLFGLRRIINTMRTKPWNVFSKDEEEEAESNG